MTRRVKVVFYAINGTGLGHLSRLLSIARAMRDLLHALDLQADLQFLTTSEAPGVAWDFPVYKLPSKTIVRRSDTPNASYQRGVRVLISNVIASLNPDLLVLDTQAAGAFQEFLFIRDLARKCAFIDRARQAAAARDPSHQNHLALYHQILVPDEAVNAARYPLAVGLEARRRFIGQVHGFSPERALSRAAVRARFHVPDDGVLYYVSAGGGGDPQSESELEGLLDVLLESPRRHLLVGYGPLYKGTRRYHPRIRALSEAGVSRYFPGVDAAISAAGYNTFTELLEARVPTLFYAQKKGLDDQRERIERGADAGLNMGLSFLDPALLRITLTALEDPDRNAALRARLAEQPPRLGALRGAVALLELHSTLDGSPVERAALYEAASLRAAWSAAPREEKRTFAQGATHALEWRRLSVEAIARDDLVARARERWRDGAMVGDDDEARDLDALRWGGRLAEWGARLGWSTSNLQRLLARLVEHAPLERRAQLQSVIDAAITTLFEHAEDAQVGDCLGAITRLTRRGERLALLCELDAALASGDVDILTRLVRLLEDTTDGGRSIESLREHLGLEFTGASPDLS